MEITSAPLLFHWLLNLLDFLVAGAILFHTGVLYYHSRQARMLFIGVGFLLAALGDLPHCILFAQQNPSLWAETIGSLSGVTLIGIGVLLARDHHGPSDQGRKSVLLVGAVLLFVVLAEAALLFSPQIRAGLPWLYTSNGSTPLRRGIEMYTTVLYGISIVALALTCRGISRRGKWLLLTALGAKMLSRVCFMNVSTLWDHFYWTGHLLIVFADLCLLMMLATENVQLFAKARKRAAELEAINQVARRIVSILDLDKLLSEVARLICQAFGYYHVAIILVEPASDDLVFKTAAGGYEGKTPPEMRQKKKEGLIGWAAYLGETILANDVSLDPRFIPAYLPETKSELDIPLKIGNRVIGVLDVQSKELNAFTEDDKGVLETLADQIAVAIENAQLYEERKAQNERISALYRIDQALISSIDLEQTLQLVIKEISAAIGVNRCSLWLLDENGQAVAGVAELRPETERVTSIIGMKLWASDQPLLEKILSEGQPIVVNDVHDPAWAHWIKKEHIEAFRLKSLLTVPLESKGQRRGVIILDDTRERHLFTPDEVALAVSAARQASIAIENARLFEETKQRLQELAMLYQVGVGITGTLDPDKVLQLVIDSAVQAIPAAEKGSLFLIDEENNELVIRAAHGYGPEVVEKVRLKLGEGHIDWVVKEKQPMVIANFQTDPRLKPFPDLEEVTAIKSAVVVPLEVKGKVIGTLALDNVTSYNAFSESDFQLLSTFASQAAVAIENAWLFEQAQQEITKRKRAEEQIQRQLQRLAALHDVDMAITSSLDLHMSLNVLLDQATTQLRVDAADVLLLNPHTQTLEYAAGRGFRSRGIERSLVRLGEGHAGQAALERRIIHMPNLAETGTNFVRAKLLANENFITYYAVPLIAKGQVKGVLEIFHRTLLGSDPEWLGFLETLAGQAAIAIDNASLFEDLQRSNVELALAYEATLEGWSRALDLRDEETEGHTQRVTELTLRLAHTMGMSDEELVHVRRGALLHDIGKMGIPDSILRKPGPPTDDEWEIIRQHPVYAYEMISPIGYLRPALDIPYCHHEKWDGTGYPRGLKGEQIPLAARIFAVVDVYDALRSDRPYRPAWSEEEARQYIREEAGKHFDPQVVEMFMRLLENGAF